MNFIPVISNCAYKVTYYLVHSPSNRLAHVLHVCLALTVCPPCMLIQFVSLLLSVSHGLRCHSSVTCSSSIVARPWFMWAHNLTPLWCVLFWMFCRVSVVSLLLSKQRTHSANIVGVLRFSYWSVITHLRHEPFYIHPHCWWFSATHPNVTYCCVPVKETWSSLNTQSHVNRMLANA